MIDPLSATLPSVAPAPPRPRNYLLQPSPDHPDDYILEIDYSSLSDFLSCPRRSFNKKVLGREANKDNSPTDFGQLFHKLEEIRRHNGLTPETVAHQTHEIQKHFATHQIPPDDHRAADRMLRTIKLYNEKFGKDELEKKVYRDAEGPFIERPFKVRLCTIEVNGHVPYSKRQLTGIDDDTFLRAQSIHIVYTGKIDLVLQEGSHLWVLDDKTSSRGGEQYYEWFRLSLQTRGYCRVVWKLLGIRPMGCILNAVIMRKPTKTGKDTDIDRRNYFYSEDSLLEWEQSVIHHMSHFISCLTTGHWPQTALSFMSPCSFCDFKENCTLPLAQRSADLASDLYRDVTWDPTKEG